MKYSDIFSLMSQYSLHLKKIIQTVFAVEGMESKIVWGTIQEWNPTYLAIQVLTIIETLRSIIVDHFAIVMKHMLPNLSASLKNTL